MNLGVHHAALCTSDLDKAMRFWRDGMGLTQIFDMKFDGEWRELFGASTDELRSIFLGDPATPETGIVELVMFDGSQKGELVPVSPTHGFFLLSFEREVEAQLAKLAALGFDDGVHRIRVAAGAQAVPMAVIAAPDGVLVELIGPAE